MAALGHCLIFVAATAPLASLPDAVTEALRRYALSVDGATVRWSRGIRILDATDVIRGDDGADLRIDPDVSKPSECCLTFRGGAYRVQETWYGRGGKAGDDEVRYSVYSSEKAFDGVRISTRVPQVSGAPGGRDFFLIESLEKCQQAGIHASAYRSNIFGTLGIMAPFLLSTHELASPRSFILDIADRPQSSTVFEPRVTPSGPRARIRVSTPDIEYVFDLDVSHGLAPVEVSRFDREGSLIRQDCSGDFQEVINCVFLPFQVDVHRYAGLGQAARRVATEEYRILGFKSGSPDPKSFVVAPTIPGSFVEDHTLLNSKDDADKGVQWMLAATPGELDRAADDARASMNRKPNRKSNDSPAQWLSVLAMAGGTFAVGFSISRVSRSGSDRKRVATSA